MSASTSSSAPSSICVLRLSAIGDVCNALAVVQSIQRHYPAARISWVVGKVEATLLQGLPGIELIVFDKSQGWRGLRDLRRQLAGRQFDVLLHMQLALRANVVSRCIPARRRIGFDRKRAKELHSLFINEQIAPQGEGGHVLDAFFQFADALDVPRQAPRWQLPVSEAEQAWAEAQLQPGASRHLVIVPAASAPERNWLVCRYAALAEYAAGQGFAVYLCGGPADSERQLAADIVAACPLPLNNLVGKSNLKQLFALLQRVSLVVSPDTGPAHMAVAAGTPVIGLYGHSNPDRTGPYRYRQYVVDSYHQALMDQFGQTADQARWGQRVSGDQLMAEISLPAVTAMFDRVVSEQQL